MINEQDEIILNVNKEILIKANLKESPEEKIRIYNAMIIDFNKSIEEIKENGSIIKENHSYIMNRAIEKMNIHFLIKDTTDERIRLINLLITACEKQLFELNKDNLSDTAPNYVATDDRKHANYKSMIDNKQTLVDEISCWQKSKKYIFDELDSYNNNIIQDLFGVLIMECCFRNIDINNIKVKNIMYLIDLARYNNYIFDDIILQSVERYSNISKKIIIDFNNFDSVKRENILLDIEKTISLVNQGVAL